VLGVWPAILVSGGTFAAVQFAISNYHGPWLVDVTAGVASLVSLALLMRVWQPAVKWRYEHETEADIAASVPDEVALTRRSGTAAWVPWVLLTVFVFAWGLPTVKKTLSQATPGGTREKPGWQVP